MVVVAEDLAHALAKLHCNRTNENWASVDRKDEGKEGFKSRRSRSSSILLFEPEQKHMPAISVDDYTDGDGTVSPPVEMVKPMVHTARPPVELMHE